MDNKEGIYNRRSNERMFSIDSECVFPLDNSLQCTGYFNYMNVELKSINEIALLYHMGFFGKGSFSRSKPECLTNNGHHKIMRKRQFSKRMSMFKRFNCSRSCSESKIFMEDVLKLTRSIAHCADKATNKNIIDLVSSDEDNNSEESINGIDQDNAVYDVDKHDIVVVVPNSDSEGENYFEKFCPKSCVCKIKIHEKLALSLQEAFFLSYGLGCLQIVDENNTVLDVNQCWELFNKTDKNFIPKYVVYHFYRSKDYIVKPGIKFGGDYLLYKDGPGLTHAAYIVLIEHQGQNVQEWTSILGHVRIAATTVKDILLAEVVRNDTEVLDGPKELQNYSVRESLITRKLPITMKDDD